MRRWLSVLPALAIFILPPEWDDVKNSVRSSTVCRLREDLGIVNCSTSYSAYTYSFTVADQGITRRLKCVRINKIPCSTGTVDVYGAIVGAHLVKENPDNTYSAPNLKRFYLIAEDLGTSFNVCPVIISDDWGTFFMDYDYYQATGQGSKSSDYSYVDVEVWMVCR